MSAAGMTTADHARADTASVAPLERLFWIVAATLLSVLFTGYVPYFNNNIYHLPILKADYDLPQFADDAFVQSLRHFSSGFWMLFAGSARFIAPKLFLFIAFLLSRALMMAASLSLAARFGYRGRVFTGLFLLLFAVSPLARGYAPGGGGLDIEYFSHSELANAVLLFCLSAALARRHLLSVFLACLTFWLNAFMAVWLAPLWLAVIAVQWRAGEIDPKRLALAVGGGTLLGLPLLLPVLHAVLAKAGSGAAPDYSYAAFLRGFFPFHFFMDSLPREDHVMIGLLVAALLPLPWLLKANGRMFLALSLAATALLTVGSLVPLVTESRLILNLHFIRSAVLLQLLAVTGMAMLAAGWVSNGPQRHDRVFGLLLASMLVFGRPAFTAMLVLLAYRAWIEARLRPTVLDSDLLVKASGAVFALSLAFTGPMLFSLWQEMRNLSAITGTWERAGRWMRDNSPPDALVLLPIRAEPLPPGTSPAARFLDMEMAGFVATSERSIWTNYKFGAAAMWAPENFRTWRSRYDEVLRLDTAAQRIAYASAHGISHVASFCDAAVSIPPAYRDGDLCIYGPLTRNP